MHDRTLLPCGHENQRSKDLWTLVLRTGFTSDVAGGALGLTAAMLEILSPTHGGEGPLADGQSAPRAVVHNCSRPRSPRSSVASRPQREARRPGYFRITLQHLRILMDPRPELPLASPCTPKTNATGAQIDIRSTFGQPLVTSGAGAATGYLPDGIFLRDTCPWDICLPARQPVERLRSWEVGSSCCSHEG